MLTCITCSKQRTEDEDEAEESARGTPSTKQAVKSLTAQMKDIALKVSGNSKQSKPNTPSSYRNRKGHRAYPDFDAISEGVSYPYMQPGSSSSSAPAWGFTRIGHNNSSRYDSRLPCGASISAQSDEVTLEDDNESKEWMAQVEPGVQITFVSLPQGGNDLKRIRFTREVFNKREAQRWWGENYDRIMELYNVQRFNRQALNTPGRSEDGRDSNYSRVGSVRVSPMMTPSSVNKEWTPRNYYKPSGGPKGEMPSMEEASRTTTDSRDEASVSISNASDVESEWIEEDEPGVYITIRQLPDGTRELRRVRFSREKFGEVPAKLWWETNRDRIQTQYL